MVKYKTTKEGLVAYSPIVRAQAWAFTIVVAVTVISGLFNLRDYLYANFGVYGRVYIPTPPYLNTIHLASGFALVILGLIHIGFHVRDKEKPLLPISTFKDFGHFLHSGMWLLFMSRKEVRGDGGLYDGRQRVTYMAFVYICGLAGITGILLFTGVLGHSLALVHIVPGGVTFMVVLFQFLIVIRKHDLQAMKSVFITGVLPLKYVRKKKPILYAEIKDDL